VIHNDCVSTSNKPSDFGLLFTLTLHFYQTEPSFWHSNHPYYPKSPQKFSEDVYPFTQVIQSTRENGHLE